MSALVTLLLGLASLGVSPEDVPVDSPVYDPGAVIAPAAKERLATELRAMYAERKVQMAIVVVDTLDGQPIEDWGIRLFERWRLGDAGLDNGLLAILVMNDRLSRLEVGYGIEPWIPDDRAKTMLDGMRGDLRAGDPGAALGGLVDDVRTALADYVPGAPPPAPPLGERPVMPLVVTLLGLAAGVAYHVGRRRLEALAARAKKAAKDDPARSPAASRLALAHKALPWVVFALVPVLLVLGFLRGDGFWFAYPGLYLAWLVTTYAIDYTARRSLAGVIVYGVLLLVLFALWFGEGLTEPWASGPQMFGATIPMWFLAMVIWLFGAMIFSKSKGGSSYASSSSRSYSSSSRSYSSSSSSSSSSRSYSSSSSSGGYSGGGGRSGGGGATSSW